MGFEVNLEESGSIRFERIKINKKVCSEAKMEVKLKG